MFLPFGLAMIFLLLLLLLKAPFLPELDDDAAN
jgi:hypothetical protein